MFNGIWLIADEPLTSQGRSVEAGETFHISRVHAGALIVTKQARVIHPQPSPKARIPDPEPVAPRRRGRPRRTPPETVDEVQAPTRQYQRRDLEAEE